MEETDLTLNKSLTVKDCWNRTGVWSRETDRCPDLKEYIHCRNCPVYSASGRKLLEHPITPEYMQEWTNVLASEHKEKETETETAFIFRSGGEWLALQASLIQEVVSMNVIHSIPHRTNNVLRGVVNIRGKLELCLSIGAVLGIEKGTEYTPNDTRFTSSERLVVASCQGQRIAFPVTEVIGNVRYSPDMIRSLPVTVSGAQAAYTRGVLCLKDLDIGFLKDEKLFDTLIGMIK